MKNFLIRLLGGITPDEFAQLANTFNSHEQARKQQVEMLETYFKEERVRVNELQTIILKKTGMIPPERPMPSVEQILNPISTRPKSWREQRAMLEKKDADSVAERWRAKDPTAKLNSEMLEELNENVSKIS